MPLLQLRDLTIEFATPSGRLRVVEGVSLALDAGETLGLVGESGSGKSVTALSIARLLPSPPAFYPEGEVLLAEEDVLRMGKARLRAVRGGMVGYVFQEPGASLNPVFRIGAQILESLRLHRPAIATTDEVVRLLERVGIPAPETRARDFPHQLSGGMQQRVMIAMAIASQPKLLVADEPTTALDVTIQAQIMDLLGDLKTRLGMGILLITHNLALVGRMADRIAVMYAGQIVETGPARELLANPLHPYTRALIESVPSLGRTGGRLVSIPGTVPGADAFPSGCRFHTRCPLAVAACRTDAPALLEKSPGRLVRCPVT